jgi:hypothetical protein
LHKNSPGEEGHDDGELILLCFPDVDLRFNNSLWDKKSCSGGKFVRGTILSVGIRRKGA